ncbi:MFS transporter [Paraburkholderia sp. DHOC27]|uniref:MFS transporter n=1 Tax=Paraburkholderia sp. DHOC27 TaxID=2303330 RepID=UPI000E3D70F1|nr:MFS transporter [Paraburkholderia sp. DHOC27]RFU49695.1 MFS transporter [Paraburkholderia sp. DHOC27]
MSTRREAVPRLPASPDERRVSKVHARPIVLSVAGSSLEWFDFLSYLFLSKTIASVFFPLSHATAGLSLTFATFAIGVIARPLGGVIFALYADRLGRFRILSLLMILMGIGTGLLGVCPSYSEVGIAAPIVMVFARILQGVAVGAQFGVASQIIVENTPAERRMFFGSFNMSAQALSAVLAATCSYFLITRLSDDALRSWGWRLPFLAGSIIGPLGVILKHHSSQVNALEHAHPERAADDEPLWTQWSSFVRSNTDNVVCAIGVITVATASNYLWAIYIPAYVEVHLRLPITAAMLGVILSQALNALCFPVAGWFADRYGAYRMFFPVVIAWALCAYPMFLFIVDAPSVARLLCMQLLAGLFQTALAGPHAGMLATLFPSRSGATGMSLSYNVAVTLFGGMAPFTINLLTEWTGNSLVPPTYLVTTAVFSIALVYATRAGRQQLAADRERFGGRPTFACKGAVK